MQFSDFAQTTQQGRLTVANTNIAQAERVLGAIDISKARHEVLITVPGKKRRRRLTILNHLDDFNRLATALSDYGCPGCLIAANVSGVQQIASIG